MIDSILLKWNPQAPSSSVLECSRWLLEKCNFQEIRFDVAEVVLQTKYFFFFFLEYGLGKDPSLLFHLSSENDELTYECGFWSF